MLDQAPGTVTQQLVVHWYPGYPVPGALPREEIAKVPGYLALKVVLLPVLVVHCTFLVQGTYARDKRAPCLILRYKINRCHGYGTVAATVNRSHAGGTTASKIPFNMSVTQKAGMHRTPLPNTTVPGTECRQRHRDGSSSVVTTSTCSNLGKASESPCKRTATFIMIMIQRRVEHCCAEPLGPPAAGSESEAQAWDLYN